MKSMTIKPLKLKSGWINAGEIVDLPKAEVERLSARGAVVLPVTADSVNADNVNADSVNADSVNEGTGSPGSK